MKKKSTRDMVMSANRRNEHISEARQYAEASPQRAISLKINESKTDEAFAPKDNEPIGVPKVKKEKKIKPQRAAATPKSTSPIFKSKIFWGCCSLGLALLLAFVAIPLIENSKTQMVSVVVAAQDIPEGMKVESSMLQLKKICKVDVSDNAVLSQDEAEGMYTQVTLMTGDMLTTAKVGKTYFEDTYLYNIPDGKMAMSVELANLAQSVSGKIRGGDVVRIYAVFDKTGNDTANVGGYAATLINELQYVEVLAVTNHNVQDIRQSKDGAQPSEGDTKDSKSIATVTLLVNHKQATVLAGLNENAAIYAALVVRGDEAKKQAALETMDSFLLKDNTEESAESTDGEVTAQ